MGAFIISIAVFLGYLVFESAGYRKKLNAVGLRISVTGTRGKTSIVRMLSSVCRLSGMNVIAKTTGSEARYILPDGSEEKIPRKGVTSVIEQKKLFLKASEKNAGCVITEVMSIDPFNHLAESGMLVRPGITIISNLRPDHLDVAGNDSTGMARLYLNDVCYGSRVFVPEQEITDFLRKGIALKGAELVEVPGNGNDMVTDGRKGVAGLFRTDVDLVMSVAQSLGIHKDVVMEGIRQAVMDIGEPVECTSTFSGKEVTFINGFAANDPESAVILLNRVRNEKPDKRAGVYALISLRNDRGERSRQWLDFLVDGGAANFNGIFLIGTHAGILASRVKGSNVLKWTGAVSVTAKIAEMVEEGAMVFGLANIHGRGMQLVEYWKELSLQQNDKNVSVNEN